MRTRDSEFPRRKSIRLKGYDYRGSWPCHLVLTTHRRQKLLSRRKLVEALVELLREISAVYTVDIHVYCIMPDHVHLVAATRGEINLVGFVHRFKGISTHVFWKHGGHGRLWQRSFYDRILRSDEHFGAAIRYILENPVREGIVDHPRRYYGSGSLV